MKKWKLNSWKNYPVKHIPDYKDQKELDLVLKKIQGFPPLVFAGERKRGPKPVNGPDERGWIPRGQPLWPLIGHNILFKTGISCVKIDWFSVFFKRI